MQFDWGIGLGLFGTVGVAAIPASIGLTMNATTKGEFKFARGCFWVSAGLAAILYCLTLWLIEGDLTVTRMIISCMVGAAIFGGLAVALDWVKQKEAVAFANTAPLSITPSSNAQAAVTSEAPTLGSLVYGNFIAEVQRHVKSKQTSVLLAVELKNTNRFLIRFHARLEGNVGGKMADPPSTEFDGYIPAGETGKLLYSRLFDVPINEKPNPQTPTMTGAIFYDVTYCAASSGDVKHRTSKRIDFDMWPPFNDKQIKKGEVRESTYNVTVRFSYEIEE